MNRKRFKNMEDLDILMSKLIYSPDKMNRKKAAGRCGVAVNTCTQVDIRLRNEKDDMNRSRFKNMEGLDINVKINIVTRQDEQQHGGDPKWVGRQLLQPSRYLNWEIEMMA